MSIIEDEKQIFYNSPAVQDGREELFMKKWMASILAAGMVLSLTACIGDTQPPVTEETLPLPLWAQDEENRLTETQTDAAETTGPVLPDQYTDPQETSSAQETVSQLPEKHPITEPTSAGETVPQETAESEKVRETEAIPSDYEMEEKFKTVTPERVYAVKSVRMRSQGNVNSDDLGRLGEGKSVTRVGTSNDGWSAVIYEGELRYIASEYLTTDDHPEPTENPNIPSEEEVDDMVYTTDDVNMREGPGFDRAVLCRVPEFIELHRTGIVSSGWCRVTYKEKEGFINAGYLSEKHPGQTEDQLVEEEEVDDSVYTTRELNFRKGPGTKKTIIGRIPEGTRVQRIAIASNGWAKVTYEGQTGYISGDYISTEAPAEG